VPARALFLVEPALRGPAGVTVALAAASTVALVAWRARRALTTALAQAAERAAAAPRRWLVLALATGIGLRLVWIAAVPTPFRSDGLSYAVLAERLAAGRPYVLAGGDLAHWPPGYPFALTPLVLLLGAARPAVLVSNVALFALLVGVTWWLGRPAIGAGATALACALLAVWPNLVTLAAVPSKELLLAVLVPAALGLTIAATRRSRAAAAGGMALAAGAVLGAATLTQPGVALLALPLAAFLVLSGGSRGAVVASIAALVVGQAAVMLPWMSRNQRMLGAPLLTTAAGSVFYRANNPAATGEHMKESQTVLAGLPELERSRRGFALGRAWIAENPGDFGLLALRKLVVFLGDDGDGVYHTLRHRAPPHGAYALARAGALAFWWVLWLGVLLATWRHRRALAAVPALLAGQLAILYFAAVDAVFEAGGRHHIPLAAVIALLAVSAAAHLPRVPAERGAR
jgi:hypothetical protein